MAGKESSAVAPSASRESVSSRLSRSEISAAGVCKDGGSELAAAFFSMRVKTTSQVSSSICRPFEIIVTLTYTAVLKNKLDFSGLNISFT